MTYTFLETLFWSFFFMIGYIAVCEQAQNLTKYFLTRRQHENRIDFGRELVGLIFAVVIIIALRWLHYYIPVTDTNEQWRLVNLQLGVFAYANITLKNVGFNLFFLVSTGLTMISYATLSFAAFIGMSLFLLGTFLFNMVSRRHEAQLWETIIFLVLVDALMWGMIPMFYDVGTDVIVIQAICFMLVQVTINLYNSFLINESRRESKLVYKTRHDGLTTVQNWAALHADFLNYFKLMVPHRAISLVILDVDRFKQINDRHGHLAGDKVLHTFAKEMQREAKSYSAAAEVYRTGGEEFAVVLPGSAVAEAQDLMYACQKRVGRVDFGVPEAITFSAGITNIHDDDVLINDSIRRGDALLYSAKRGGRNQIRV